MKLHHIIGISVLLGLAPAAMAQKWEFGGAVGGSFYGSQDVTNGSSSAAASFEKNIAGSIFLDNSSGKHWGGEVRYDYERGDMRLSQGAIATTYGAESHAMHYDFLWHATAPGSSIRPFVAFGGGLKFYRGTGADQVAPPLMQYALLTRAVDYQPMVSVGAGVKFNLSKKLQFRLEVHDYMTPFPNKVIAPNTGSKTGGWMQNIVPSVGIAALF
jgi:hypothetical protein